MSDFFHLLHTLGVYITPACYQQRELFMDMNIIILKETRGLASQDMNEYVKFCEL
jgi:hypothetical protein